jgi:hypothetical protein
MSRDKRPAFGDASTEAGLTCNMKGLTSMSRATSTTRRDLIRLATAAGAGSVLGVPAIAVADPIYAAIEHHREVIRPWDAAATAADELMGEWYALRAGPFEKPPAEMAAAIAEAEEHQDVMSDLEARAVDALVETVPTTLTGLLAAIRYVLGYSEGTSEMYPGRSHDLLGGDRFLTFLGTIGDGIEAALPSDATRRR